MNNYAEAVRVKLGERRISSVALTMNSRPELSLWITVHDVEALREALAHGSLPPDLRAKLRGLANGNLSHRFVEQNCRLFAALLLAVEDGSFHDISPAERERLLRVLAYVRKDEDAIPDFRVDGYADDQREILAVTVELGRLLQAFKAWRLRHQVPEMWHEEARDSHPAGVDHRFPHLDWVRSRAA